MKNKHTKWTIGDGEGYCSLFGNYAILSDTELIAVVGELGDAKKIAASPNAYELLRDLDLYIDSVMDNSKRKEMKRKLAAYLKTAEG